MTEIVTEKLKMLPTDPGVYIMKNAEGTVIYVGKAKNLKNRVKQYFYTGVKTDKVMAMVSHVSDFDYIITPTETRYCWKTILSKSTSRAITSF